MNKNIIFRTDSYKLNHWNQAPAGTTRNLAYLESRPGALFPYVVWVGLQAILKEKLAGRVVTRKAIEEAALLCQAHFGNDKSFNRKMWERILRKHKGRLPVRIKAVKEGSVIPTGNVLMTVENTDPKCAPLTNGLESVLTHVWYPTTVATLSHSIKDELRKGFDRSSDNPAALDFMLHDFGYRSVSSDESAEFGSGGHLSIFKGTDTVVGLMFVVTYYAELVAKSNPFEGIAFSVPATEHSIMTALGRDGETSVVRNLITEYPDGILSVVGDSYDIYNFVDVIMGKTLKTEILNRNGVFVVRPDSVTPTHPTPEAEMVWIMENLAQNFGYTTNSKGYKVINPKVRVLWGDGIDRLGIYKIVDAIIAAGFSIENIATFGMGGGLLQKINRDTQRFAFKSCWQERNGIGYDIFKCPLDKSKESKKGRIKLVKDNGKYLTVAESDPRPDILETVFLNGKIMRHQPWSEVRQLASEIWTG